MKNKKQVYINITTVGVIKIILIIILFYLLFLVKDILAVLFVSLILASAIDPLVDWMQKRKIPRGLGVILIYILLFGIIGTIVSLIIPIIIEQSNDLINSFPNILEKIISGISALKNYSSKFGILDNVKENFGAISSNIQSATISIFSTISGIFSNIFSFFLILVMTFYMVVEENAIKKIIWSITPKKNQVYIMQLADRMQKKIGLWLRAQLILSLIIFILTYIGLLILGIKYALILALIAGLTEFVPYLGPIIASIPAIFLAFTQKPILAILVAILYYIIQLTENNLIVPKLMQKVVGLNPIISIAVLIIGFKLGGVIGAILSIPVATAFNVFVKDYFQKGMVENKK